MTCFFPNSRNDFNDGNEIWNILALPQSYVVRWWGSSGVAREINVPHNDIGPRSLVTQYKGTMWLALLKPDDHNCLQHQPIVDRRLNGVWDPPWIVGNEGLRHTPIMT